MVGNGKYIIVFKDEWSPLKKNPHCFNPSHSTIFQDDLKLLHLSDLVTKECRDSLVNILFSVGD